MGMRRVVIPLQQYLSRSGFKVVVGMPMYRQVSVSWLYNWLLMDKQPCVGIVSTEGVRLPVAMNAIVKTALNAFTEWEWLVVLEDDILPPSDAFLRVSRYGDEYDIVGSMNFTHEPPHQVCALTRRKGELLVHDYLDPEVLRRWAAKPGLYPVDAVAMGFTAIRRCVLEGWDPAVPMWQPIPPIGGQDIHFCYEAQKQGYSVWLDTSMRCGHVSEFVADYRHFEATNVCHPAGV